jgi:anti-sigma-K factor RskA
MSYNIEEQEDYLKNHSPYDGSEHQWDAMQQRIKQNVLAAVKETSPLKKKAINYWKITTLAASICAIIALCFALFPSHQTTESDSVAINKNINPEQNLDNTINHLNDAELNWLHQLNENDLNEQNEYSEN